MKYKSYLSVFKDFVKSGCPKNTKEREKISLRNGLGAGALGNEITGIERALKGDVERFSGAVFSRHTLNVLVDACEAGYINERQFFFIHKTMVNHIKSEKSK